MTFIDRMTKHWTTKLGLSLSKPLIKGWLQLEQAVQQACDGTDKWQVLQLPTGSGKTEALKVLCSLQSPIECPGILIVTKFRQEADEIARDINELASGRMARSYHTDAPTSDCELGFIPVLAITHSAYRRALQEKATNGSSARLERFGAYQVGYRELLIIDEAIDWVDAYDINLGDLRAMCGDLAGVIEGRAKADVEHVGDLAKALTLDVQGRPDRMLSPDQFALLSGLDFAVLTNAVSELPEQVFAAWKDTEQPTDLMSCQSVLRTPFRTRYLDVLSHLQAIAGIGFAWTSNRRGKALLHSSRSLLGVDGKHGVILDATADIDPTYSLAQKQVRVLPRPEGIRSYSNVKLHLSHGHRLGKEHLVQRAATHWPIIWGQLSERLAGKRPLVCAHKDVTSVIRQYSTDKSSVEVAHWGNLDGKNDWRASDAAVFFGLPYLDDIVPVHAFFAHQGPKCDDWFTGNRSFGDYADIRRSLQDGFIARSVVQAINRTRCRKPIDSAGNCHPTDLYLLLPSKGITSDLVTTSIRHQMPGIGVAEWEAGATKRKARKAPAEARLVAYFDNAPDGIHFKSAVVRGLRTNARSFERMTAELRKPSPIAEKLAALRVRYHSNAGRGREAYFIKE